MAISNDDLTLLYLVCGNPHLICRAPGDDGHATFTRGKRKTRRNLDGFLSSVANFSRQLPPLILRLSPVDLAFTTFVDNLRAQCLAREKLLIFYAYIIISFSPPKTPGNLSFFLQPVCESGATWRTMKTFEGREREREHRGRGRLKEGETLSVGKVEAAEPRLDIADPWRFTIHEEVAEERYLNERTAR